MVQCALVLIEISWSLFSCFPFHYFFLSLSLSWGKWLDDLRWSITQLPVTGLHGFKWPKLHCTKMCNWPHQALSRHEYNLSIHPLISIAIHICALRARSVLENSKLKFTECAGCTTMIKGTVQLKMSHYVVQNPYCCVKMRFYGPFWKQ